MSKYGEGPGFWDTDFRCFRCVKSVLLLWKKYRSQWI